MQPRKIQVNSWVQPNRETIGQVSKLTSVPLQPSIPFIPIGPGGPWIPGIPLIPGNPGIPILPCERDEAFGISVREDCIQAKCGFGNRYIPGLLWVRADRAVRAHPFHLWVLLDLPCLGNQAVRSVQELQAHQEDPVPDTNIGRKTISRRSTNRKRKFALFVSSIIRSFVRHPSTRLGQTKMLFDAGPNGCRCQVARRQPATVYHRASSVAFSCNKTANYGRAASDEKQKAAVFTLHWRSATRRVLVGPVFVIQTHACYPAEILVHP